MINSKSWLPTTLKSESRVVWEWAIRCLYASLYPSHAWLIWAQTQFASDSKASIHVHGARPLSSVPSLLCVSLSGAHLCAAFGPGPVIDAHFTLTNYHHITLACPSPRWWTLPIVFWPVPISYKRGCCLRLMCCLLSGALTAFIKSGTSAVLIILLQYTHHIIPACSREWTLTIVCWPVIALCPANVLLSADHQL